MPISDDATAGAREMHDKLEAENAQLRRQRDKVVKAAQGLVSEIDSCPIRQRLCDTNILWYAGGMKGVIAYIEGEQE